MNRATARSRAFICGVAQLAVQPSVVAAQPASPSLVAPELDVSSVRHVLESAGYAIGPAVPWGEQTLVIEGRADSGRIVRAFVYRDAQAAGAARGHAYAHQAGPSLTPFAIATMPDPSS